MDKFGAICSYKGGSDGIVISWPIDIAVKDSTGAGDTFAAGVVSKLAGKSDFSVYAFTEAIVEGRAWSAFACTMIEGAGEIPDKNELTRFRKEI